MVTSEPDEVEVLDSEVSKLLGTISIEPAICVTSVMGKPAIVRIAVNAVIMAITKGVVLATGGIRIDPIKPTIVRIHVYPS